MGIIKANPKLVKQVRDLMWEQRAVAVTTEYVAILISSAPNGQRGQSTGGVHRALRELVTQRWVLDKGKGQYQWSPAQTKPHDFVPVTTAAYPPPPKPITGITGNISALAAMPKGQSMPTTNDDNKKREDLRGRLKGRMAEITEDRIETEEVETVPEPKKNAAPGYPRSNGDTYLPRIVAGKSDVEVLRTLRNAKRKLYPLLSGPPGTGKTVLVDAAFWDQPGGLYVINGDENTGVPDFVGQWAPTEEQGKYQWVDGPLVKAMKNGGVLLVDDATLINPKANAVMYPVLDGRNYVTIKDHMVNGKPEVVHAQPGFFVVAAHNPGVHGAILTDALSSRFTWQMWVETDLELAASLGVNNRFLKLVKTLRRDRDEGNQGGLWIPQLRELITARDISHTFNEVVAAQNMLSQTPEEDREWMASKMRLIFGEDVAMLELGGQLL